MLTELSSRRRPAQPPPELFRSRKVIPLGYGIFYMRGENHNIRTEITRNMLPIGTVETQGGKILAIIDQNCYVRIMQRLDHYIFINLIHDNQIITMSHSDIAYYNIPVNQKWED